MAGSNVIGDHLELYINNVILDNFEGYKYNEIYDMRIHMKNEEWMQYVIHFSNGKGYTDLGRSICDGKQLLVNIDLPEIDFKWSSPSSISNFKKNDEDIIITIAYAPYYTQVFIQTFKIPHKTEKIDNHNDL